MITPAYVRTMAAYNAEMNRRLYGAAARLSDADPLKETSRAVCRFIFEEWRSRDLTRPAWERERIQRARGVQVGVSSRISA